MNMNKKGFTLVELLAVIVILALIIVIAVIKIKNSLKKSDISAIEADASVFVKAVNDAASTSRLTNELDDGNYTVAQLLESSINISGTKPESGRLVISEGEVVSGCLAYGEYAVSINNKQILKPELGECYYAVYEYDFSGEVIALPITKSGTYQLEVWGAQGGSYNDEYHGGYGGYATGEYYLTSGQTVYIVIGGEGTTSTANSDGGYDNGGNGYGRGYTSGSGGGATFIALENRGLLDNFSQNVDDLIIVAGGGGGSMYNTSYPSYYTGGSGGGYISGSPIGETDRTHSVLGEPANQLNGGSYLVNYNSSYSGMDTSYTNGKFGKGGTYSSTSAYAAGGGAGYYGGSAGYLSGAYGGSGYIGNNNLSNKHMYCYNCPVNANNLSVKTLSDGTSSCHDQLPKSDCAKENDGYARITYLG